MISLSQPAEPLNMNHYATKKSVAESMLDVALLMANASQLKAVLEQGPEFKYFLTVIILIAASLFFQVLAGALFVNMGERESHHALRTKSVRDFGEFIYASKNVLVIPFRKIFPFQHAKTSMMWPIRGGWT